MDHEIKLFAECQKRTEIYRVLKKIGVKRLAEIGVWRGYNMSYMLKCEPELAIGVDPWKKCDYYYYWDDNFLEEKYEQVCKLAIDNPCFLPIRMNSTKASKLFPSYYFDYIYIDGKHDYESIKEDIKHWWPKIKQGKFLAGHDYYQGKWKYFEKSTQDNVTIDVGVKKAVDEFSIKNNLSLVVFTDSPMPSWVVKKPIERKIFL